MQLDRVLRFNESDFELFLYYGQVNKNKEEFSIRVPLKISLCALHQWFFTAVVSGPQSGHGVTDYQAAWLSSNVLVNDVDGKKCGLP